eukprot:1159403-Pelagomonas_calceolata.AAC.4
MAVVAPCLLSMWLPRITSHAAESSTGCLCSLATMMAAQQRLVANVVQLDHTSKMHLPMDQSLHCGHASMLARSAKLIYRTDISAGVEKERCVGRGNSPYIDSGKGDILD